MHIIALIVFGAACFWLGNLAGWSLKADQNLKHLRTYEQVRNKVLDDIAEQVKEVRGS